MCSDRELGLSPSLLMIFLSLIIERVLVGSAGWRDDMGTLGVNAPRRKKLGSTSWY